MDVVKRFLVKNKKKRISIIVSACKYGTLSGYAFIVKLDNEAIIKKVVTVKAKFPMLIVAGLMSALKSIPKKKNIEYVDIYIPISKQAVLKDQVITVIDSISRGRKVRIFPKSGKTMEANVLCIEKLRYLSEINGLHIAGGTNYGKEARA